jgi:hypothetical protein
MWVVDTTAHSVMVLCPDIALVTYSGDQEITDVLFPGLLIVANDLFS